ncbi:MAG: cysteine desulfurase [Polyangiaceae bacterium]|nr:cysteine desulfurase [Polyangiaceae bacterium]
MDVQALRSGFPILEQRIHGHPLVYLDNAATTHKPQEVLDAVQKAYARINSNVHRGLHLLSERATEAYEAARDEVRAFLGAEDRREIVFVRGATEGINVVAEGLARSLFQPGDEVVLTAMEHHANIVPWQRVRDERGVMLRVVDIDERGELRLDELARVLGPRTTLVAVTHVSNALGTVNPVREVVSMAHLAGALVLVDGAQAVPHEPVDVRALDCDFYVFSGHKIYGPTGIGVLYGKAAQLERLPPYQLGGDMIRSVTFERTEYAELPSRLEAGTPHIAGAIGLGEALRYVRRVGLPAIAAHEHALLVHATTLLSELPGLHIYGTSTNKAAVLSFTIDKVHPHDVGTLLDGEGVAVRAGHHCTQPLMQRLGVPATTRASFALYNTHAEVEALARALRFAIEVLG